ncbi:MAG: response regulator [Candidatus Thiodiazotropha sp. (ex. Lucinisca nassula)]|nr:response regulator [Candidatus Thiodiazotropha sp. (ex. Lucinisca nassula)]MBW9268737.1 response regulator [Candidatus Thiodiazotropha sp. (ex. Lucinisca nassula)]
MKIRHKLLATIGLIVLLGLLFLTVLYRTHELSRSNTLSDDQLYQIQIGSYELSVLTYEAILHPQEARPKQQWLNKHRTLMNQIEGIEFDYSLEQRNIKKLKSNLLTISELFKRLSPATEHSQTTISPDITLLQQKRQRIAASIQSVALEVAASASELRTSVNNEHIDSMQRMFTTAFAVTLISTLLLISLSFGVFRNIFTAVNNLLKGVTQVTKGDLSYRSSLHTDDELEEYANAFNEMVSRLDKTMASRDLLNKEIIKQKATEKKLREYKNELENKVRERTEALEKSRLAAISIMEDVNIQRKKAVTAQQQTENTNKELEQEITQRLKVENRLRENETSLKHAIIEADSANRAKSIFLANMSHELRTPLNAILGFSEILIRDNMLSRDQRDSINIINRSGEHLLDMINDVLDLSKIESGKIEIEERPLDLKKMLYDIESMINIRVEHKGLKFTLEFAENLSQFVVTDAGKLRQILINLLGNAVKYTERGGISLRVKSDSLDGQQDRVMLCFEVEDSGIGIPEDKYDAIFIPFVQTGSSDHQGKGTGLGLAISKSLVELLGGQISVQSVVDKGSIFSFQVPVAPTHGSETSEDITTSKPAVLSLAPDQPEWRILIADDNKENLQLLKKLLTQVGFRVKEAKDGQEAIDIYKQWRPDFIWMDMRMPNVDGYEATRIIRNLPNGDNIKIVAITASAFKEQKSKILDAGCDEVVRKPYRSYEIFDVMSDVLGASFIYDATTVDEQPNNKLVSSDRIDSLPQEIVDNLFLSSKQLDAESILSIVEDNDIITEDISEVLVTLAKEFRFDTIIEMLSQHKKITDE